MMSAILLFLIRIFIGFLLVVANISADGQSAAEPNEEEEGIVEPATTIDRHSSHLRSRKSVRPTTTTTTRNPTEESHRTLQSGVSISLKPIRYCSDKRLFSCKAHGYPHGTYWEGAGMPDGHQDKAFFATMGSIPSTSNIEYIAIFSSGQQGSSGGSSGDSENVVSGATDDYKWNTNENPSEPRTVDGNSVAAQFYHDVQSRFLPQSKTLYLTLWDAQFNHLDSTSEKTNTLKGYTDYLDSKVKWNNIKGVVLVGSSRGGCLALRLGEYLRTHKTVSTTDFAIATIDAVCRHKQSEFGVTSSTVDNPLSAAPNSYKSYEVNMNNQFPYGTRSRHCLWHLAVGDEVTGLGFLAQIRGLSHTGCESVNGCTLLDEYGEEYYQQQWGAMTHKEAGRNYGFASETVDPILNHLAHCKSRFGWN